MKVAVLIIRMHIETIPYLGMPKQRRKRSVQVESILPLRMLSIKRRFQ